MVSGRALCENCQQRRKSKIQSNMESWKWTLMFWRRKTKENIKLVFTQKVLIHLPYITKQTNQIIFLHLNFEILLF